MALLRSWHTLTSEEAAIERRTEQLAGSFDRQGWRCSVEDIRRALQQASAEFAPRLITASARSRRLTGLEPGA
jgi:hypothetical protein